MNKLLISFIISYIVLTAVLAVIRPEMHKPFVFSPSQTTVENIPEITAQEDDTKIVHVQQYEEENPNIKFEPQTSQIQQEIKFKPTAPEYIQNVKPEKPKTAQQNNNIIKHENQNINTKPQKPKYELPKSVLDIVNNKSPKNQEIEKPAPKQEPQAPEKIAQKPQQTVQKPIQHQQRPIHIQNNAPLTEAEEIIVWNKWRSDLQNKVMRDSTIAAERGTVFRFSFTVNKFGQISNLKVWSDSPEYTNYAIQKLKPQILSYQGQPIMRFPARTKRITTNVEGAFVVSNQDRYTTPGDYSDIERVR